MAKKVDLDEDDFDETLDEASPEDVSADEPAEESKPKARNSTLTLALCVLNVLAALVFFYLLILDFQKRQEWSYVVFMNELIMQGLPLKEEDEAPSGSRATLPRQKLDSKQINDVFNPRGGKGGEFWPVDEPLPTRIQAQHLTPEILKDYFGPLGMPVATLEEEVKRLKAKVPADIARVAQDASEAYRTKDDAAKRKLAENLLLPLAYDIFQVEALERKIKSAKGPELDSLYEEAVQRRLLIDILAPCEIYRPGDVGTFLIEKVADLNNFKLDQLQQLLQKRFDIAIADKFDGTVHLGTDWNGEKRLSWEKRQTIGFLLVAIANVQKPDFANTGKVVHLYPDAGTPAGTPNMLRAQTVLGLYEFADAAQHLPLAWRTLEEQLIRSIHVDREGFDIVYKDKTGNFKDLDGKLTRNRAFIDKHALEIRRIIDLTAEIKTAQDRLKDLQDQSKSAQRVVEERSEHLNAMTKTLVAARAETARQVAELRKLQAELFQAQKELRDADERNVRLLEEIRAEERKASGLRGAKTP